MNRVGVIYELEERKALVLTSEGEFVLLKRQNHMLLGQQVRFNRQDIHMKRKWNNKYAAIASTVAAVFVAVLLLMNSFNLDKAYCFINIDINPSIEFVLDSKYNIIEAKPINGDGEFVLDSIEIEKRHIEDVFLDLIKKSIDFEFIKPETHDIVLVSAALNDKEFSIKRNKDEQKILELMDSIGELKGQFNKEFNISVETLKVTAKEREEALEKNVSMGKYNLYLKAKKIKKDIELEDVEKVNISELMEMLENEDGEEEKVSIQTKEPEKTFKPIATPNLVTTPNPVTTPKQEVMPEVVGTIEPPSTKLPKATREPLPTGEIIKTPVPPPVTQGLTPTPKNSGKTSKSLKIQYYCENDTSESRVIDYSFRVLNTSRNVVNLKDVKVRYYFKDNADIPLGLYVYYFSHGEESEVHGEFYDLSGKNSANKYLELGFMTGKIKPGEFVYVQGAFYRDDWSKLYQKDDYSFNPRANSYVDWKRMTAYISDVLVWGIEPN